MSVTTFALSCHQLMFEKARIKFFIFFFKSFSSEPSRLFPMRAANHAVFFCRRISFFHSLTGRLSPSLPQSDVSNIRLLLSASLATKAPGEPNKGLHPSSTKRSRERTHSRLGRSYLHYSSSKTKPPPPAWPPQPPALHLPCPVTLPPSRLLQETLITPQQVKWPSRLAASRRLLGAAQQQAAATLPARPRPSRQPSRHGGKADAGLPPRCSGAGGEGG